MIFSDCFLFSIHLACRWSYTRNRQKWSFLTEKLLKKKQHNSESFFFHSMKLCLWCVRRKINPGLTGSLTHKMMDTKAITGKKSAQPTWKPVTTSSAEFHCTGLWPQTAGQTAGSLGNHNPVHIHTNSRKSSCCFTHFRVTIWSKYMKYCSEPTCSVSANMTMRFLSSRTRSGSSQYDCGQQTSNLQSIKSCLWGKIIYGNSRNNNMVIIYEERFMRLA